MANPYFFKNLNKTQKNVVRMKKKFPKHSPTPPNIFYVAVTKN